MPKGRRAPAEGQQTLDGEQAAVLVKGAKYISGRPFSAWGSDNGQGRFPVCRNWFTKPHLHYSEPCTFQGKSLKHPPGQEFWAGWHPEPLCRVKSKGTFCLCLALWMGTSSRRCAGQVETQQRRVSPSTAAWIRAR